MPTKDEIINKLWENSNHGTRREAIESTFNAAVIDARGKLCEELAVKIKSLTAENAEIAEILSINSACSAHSAVKCLFHSR